MRHNFWEIWREVRANLPLSRGGVLCNISPREAHFSPPPPNPPDNFCIVPYKASYRSVPNFLQKKS